MVNVKRAVQLVRDFAALDNAKLEQVRLSEDERHWFIVLGTGHDAKSGLPNTVHLFRVNTKNGRISEGSVVSADEFMRQDKVFY